MKKKTKIILSFLATLAVILIAFQLFSLFSLQVLLKKVQSGTTFIKGDIHTKATLQFSKKGKVTMYPGAFIM